MGVSQKKVSVQDLEVGMFVADLDRPWHLTPFPIQGFYIRSQEEIRALVSHCRWVMVDVAEARDELEYSEAGAPSFARRASRKVRDSEIVKLAPVQIRNPVDHQTTRSLKKELKACRNLIDSAAAAIEDVASALRTESLPDLRPITRVARTMTASVMRNPDALLWLTRVREHDDHTYRHSMRSAVWALVFGRHLGLDESLLTNLATGCLLAHIGKAELPTELLFNEQQLDAEQFREFRTYVERGARRLEEAGMPRAVVAVVRGHRERHNGSGFPAGVRGDRIPLLAKLAGLVDFYESLIAPRQGYEPLSPAQAVSQLFELRNVEFQEDLVEKFIQAIGIYPIGTLVQLTNGQRGIVVSHSPKRRLMPRVMVMTDTAQQPLRSAKMINLAAINEGRKVEDSLRVEGCLPNGTEGLDPKRYDVTGAETRWNLRRLVGA
ncbi:HD-GYP domain-containing protein [Marinobacter daqiaonensis]|uniref:HD-GYP domain-containing protein n=1 Tax=Marinobacter daqiaonensis TaxID=650891 RepID=UPI000B854908|nr:HD-GYP domain-containing protein [Marinobacter daqiaonensis]